MDNRKYNIFFHLHTVSGIVICVGLFIIFFAGAFTLFVHPIEHWEANPGQQIHAEAAVSGSKLDLNKVTAAIKKEGYDLYGRNLYLSPIDENEWSVYLSETADSTASGEAKKNQQLKLDGDTYKISKRDGDFSLGSLLYDLHFYYQLGNFGYYLSGIVALFFLFALVTGVLIHWEKIISNFYVFRPKEKLKTVWTDAHTALGTIGLPFQFMYALTGAMFGLGILVSLSGSILYGGDRDKFYSELHGEHHDSLGVRVDVSSVDLNVFLDSARNHWEGFEPKFLSMLKCESSTMQFRAYGFINPKIKFLNGGEVAFDVFTGKVTHEHNPYAIPYSESVWPVVWKLHYADYGEIGTLEDYLLKAVYFLMAIATCFVIISGVLIWLEARNKKSTPEKEKRYNKRVGYIYLAICLAMFPVTAFSFLVSKLLPESISEHREILLNAVFSEDGFSCLSGYFSERAITLLLNIRFYRAVF